MRIKLDEQNKTADIKNLDLLHKADTMGSVYPGPDGNFIISYGSCSQTSVQEMSPDGDLLWELHLKGDFKTYRAYKYKNNLI